MKSIFICLLLPFYLLTQNSDGAVIYSCQVNDGGYYKSTLSFSQSESLFKKTMKRNKKKVTVKSDNEKMKLI